MTWSWIWFCLAIPLGLLVAIVVLVVVLEFRHGDPLWRSRPTRVRCPECGASVKGDALVKVDSWVDEYSHAWSTITRFAATCACGHRWEFTHRQGKRGDRPSWKDD